MLELGSRSPLRRLLTQDKALSALPDNIMRLNKMLWQLEIYVTNQYYFKTVSKVSANSPKYLLHFNIYNPKLYLFDAVQLCTAQCSQWTQHEVDKLSWLVQGWSICELWGALWSEILFI